MPPTRVATTGRPRQSASTTTLPIPSDRDLAERLAARARESVEPWLATPEEYAARLREAVLRLGH